MSKKSFSWLAIGTILALLLGYWTAEGLAILQAPKQNPLSATLWPKPRPIQNIQLQDQKQASFTVARFKERWTFVFLGYSQCPEICPTTLTELNLVHSQLQAHPKALAETQFAFVSVDPERDSPAHLGQYVRYFNPNFLGLTGSLEELDKLARQLGLVFAKVLDPGNQSYSIDHSTAIILVDPKARLHAVFSSTLTPQQIYTDFLEIRKRFKQNKV